MDDTTARGTLFKKSDEDAYAPLEEMAVNNFQWPSERSTMTKVVGIHVVDLIVALIAQVSSLTTHLVILTNQHGQPYIEIAAANRMILPDGGYEQVQYVNNQNFNTIKAIICLAITI